MPPRAHRAGHRVAPIAAALACLGAASAPRAAEVAVYVLAGQSNMEGVATVGCIDAQGDVLPGCTSLPYQLDPGHPLAAPQPDVLIWNHHAGHMAWEPLQAGVNTATSLPGPVFGPEVALGDALALESGTTVHVVKYAVGATFLAPPTPGEPLGPQAENSWDPDQGVLYGRLLARLDAARTALAAQGDAMDVRAVCWAQGTQDAIVPAHAAAYEDRLRTFVERVRSDLFLGGYTQSERVPFAISEVRPQLAYSIAPDVTRVREAEVRVACEDDRVALFDTIELSSLPDGIHFDAVGQLLQGAKFYGALRRLPWTCLEGSTAALSVQAGGVQTFELDATPDHAGMLYSLLGSASGTEPGIPSTWFTVPLQPDPYYHWTLNHFNTAALQNSFAFLDGAGRSTSHLVLPPGAELDLAGVVLHHAFVVWDLQSPSTLLFVSNPVATALLP